MMKLYELANPSDPYTFYAPSIEVAGCAAVLLSSGFGAVPVDGDGETTPVVFGWNEWLKEKGIDSDWIENNSIAVADALDSFLIGDASKRADVESMLEMLPEEKREQWKNERQNRNRSSMNMIGESAYDLAKKLRRNQKEPNVESTI